MTTTFDSFKGAAGAEGWRKPFAGAAGPSGIDAAQAERDLQRATNLVAEVVLAGIIIEKIAPSGAGGLDFRSVVNDVAKKFPASLDTGVFDAARELAVAMLAHDAGTATGLMPVITDLVARPDPTHRERLEILAAAFLSVLAGETRPHVRDALLSASEFFMNVIFEAWRDRVLISCNHHRRRH